MDPGKAATPWKESNAVVKFLYPPNMSFTRCACVSMGMINDR